MEKTNRIAIVTDAHLSKNWGYEVKYMRESQNYFKDYFLDISDVNKGLTKTFDESGVVVYETEDIPEYYLDIEITVKETRAELYDVHVFGSYLLVSDKAKKVISESKHAPYQVFPVMVKKQDNGEYVEYYLLHVKQWVEVEPEEGSFDYPGLLTKSVKAYVCGLVASDIHRESLNMLGIWRQESDFQHFYMSETLVDKLKKSGCTGLEEKSIELTGCQGSIVSYV